MGLTLNRPPLEALGWIGDAGLADAVPLSGVLGLLWSDLLATVRDLLPIVLVVLFFQWFVLRRAINNLPQFLWGLGFVLLGLTCFLVGLKLSLFPLGNMMAQQLTSLSLLGVVESDSNAAATVSLPWHRFYWTYLFAFCVGLSTTVAEPSLIAVALKAEEVSGGAVNAWGLRIAVAVGVGIGVALGTWRIVTGFSLPAFIIGGYVIVVVQTIFAPKQIVPLAYDSGGVTTSTVTVPLVTALGLGLSARIDGRNPLLDGFGLIAFASVFPMITVMGYAQLAAWWQSRRDHGQSVETTDNTETGA
jgi:hypothetical protein